MSGGHGAANGIPVTRARGKGRGKGPREGRHLRMFSKLFSSRFDIHLTKAPLGKTI
nr:MAG TPA: hypothetical protein [Caudoviricetes sp.]